MSAVLEIGELSVGAGEIVAVLGGNGAGKTGLLETILGFRSGRVSLFGRDVTSLAVEQRVLSGLGYVPEGRRVFAALTVRENLEAACALPADQRRQRVGEMLALFPMLAERPQARAWLLSGGQQQMLALARALMNKPRDGRTACRPGARRGEPRRGAEPRPRGAPRHRRRPRRRSHARRLDGGRMTPRPRHAGSGRSSKARGWQSAPG